MSTIYAPCQVFVQCVVIYTFWCRHRACNTLMQEDNMGAWFDTFTVKGVGAWLSC